MAVHGPFKNKDTAEEFASKMRQKGFTSSPYKKKSGMRRWYCSVSR